MHNGEVVEILGLSIVKSVVEAKVVCQLSALLSKQHCHKSKRARFDKGKKNGGINEKALH